MMTPIQIFDKVINRLARITQRNVVDALLLIGFIFIVIRNCNKFDGDEIVQGGEAILLYLGLRSPEAIKKAREKVKQK